MGDSTPKLPLSEHLKNALHCGKNPFLRIASCGECSGMMFTRGLGIPALFAASSTILCRTGALEGSTCFQFCPVTCSIFSFALFFHPVAGCSFPITPAPVLQFFKKSSRQTWLISFVMIALTFEITIQSPPASLALTSHKALAIPRASEMSTSANRPPQPLRAAAVPPILGRWHRASGSG
jgi:hypothetical protein